MKWSCLGVLLLLAACAAPAPQTCGIRPFVQVPVRVVNNVPLVQARINGAAVTLLLDTGAEQVLLTQDAVRRLRLATDARRPITVRGTGGAVTSFGAQLRDFTLAGLDIPDHTVAVLPYPLPSTVTEPIDGLLGVTVLSAFDIDLDMPGGKMTLYGGLVCPTTAIPPWRTPFAMVPAEVSPRGRISLAMQVGPRAMQAMIDTGTTFTVISTDAALASGATQARLDASPAVTLRGAGPQPVAARLLSFPKVQIGPEVLRDSALIVTDRQGAPVDIILGMDYLGLRRLWLSYARQQVFIMAQPGR